ncbi:hypothetical protein EBT25_10065 [bacterium]|nr:hypothetical protein [bacterium]
MSYIGNTPFTAAFLTDTFSGNGSTVAFTMTVAPANTSSIIVAVTGVLQDPSTYSVSGTTLTFSAAPPSGTSNISVRYLGIPASGVTTTAYRTVTNFTATAGQTSFSVPSYTVGYIDVYRNGVRLVSTDYTATTGTTVVLSNACTVGDAVVTESFLVSSVLNAIPNTGGSVSASNLAASGTGSSSNFLRGDMAWTSATGTGSVALASLPTFSTTIGVGGATASASGSGISFPATQSASSDANTLDDYEEGTWTPAIAFGGSSTGVTYQAYSGARYTKIGNRVFLTGSIFLTSKGSQTGSATITGLPFAEGSGNPGKTSTSIDISDISFINQIFGVVGASSSSIFLSQVTTAGTRSDITNTNFANSSVISFNTHYQIN